MCASQNPPQTCPTGMAKLISSYNENTHLHRCGRWLRGTIAHLTLQRNYQIGIPCSRREHAYLAQQGGIIAVAPQVDAAAKVGVHALQSTRSAAEQNATTKASRPPWTAKTHSDPAEALGQAEHADESTAARHAVSTSPRLCINSAMQAHACSREG